MSVVRGDEPLNLLGSDGGICEVGPLEALAAQDRKPDLHQVNANLIDWTPGAAQHWSSLRGLECPRRMRARPGESASEFARLGR